MASSPIYRFVRITVKGTLLIIISSPFELHITGDTQGHRRRSAADVCWNQIATALFVTMRQWILKVSLVVAGLTIGAGLSEVVIRLFVSVPDVGEISVSRFRLSSNLDIGYEPVPFYSDNGHLEPDFSLRGGFNEMSNSLGFRDREHSLQPVHGRTRILILGDSISVGWAISNYSDTYVPQLERLLREAGHDVELLNFSVSGYNTGQEVELLKEKGLNFRPDLILLQYCVNDSHDPWPANMHFAQTLLKRQHASGPSFLRLGSYLNKSALYRFVKFRALNKVLSAPTHAPYGHLAQDAVHENLRKLKRISSAENVPVVVLFFPANNKDGLISSSGEAEKVRRWAEELQLHFIDLSISLQNCAAEFRTSPFIDQFHLSVFGHRCSARALATEISQLLKARLTEESGASKNT